MPNKIIKQFIFHTDDRFKLFGSGTFESSLDHFYYDRKKTTIPLSNSKGIQLYNLQNIVNGYCNLSENWDSYGADPISHTAIKAALIVIDQLKRSDIFSEGIEVNVFPMRNGGIQFEFDAEGVCAELEIDVLGEMTLITYDAEANILDRQIIYGEELTEISNLLTDASYAR
jgi:hypothetical protein